MEKIIYKTETGIAIIHPARSIEDCMKDIPEGSEYKIVEESEIPNDRTFRNAWKYDLKEDIPKSKEIWKNKLRAARKPLLESLDVEYMKALESGDNTLQAGIVTRKQVLRDVTAIVDKAKTISEIKNVKIQEVSNA